VDFDETVHHRDCIHHLSILGVAQISSRARLKYAGILRQLECCLQVKLGHLQITNAANVSQLD
jgi:hypothetical protein